uniref:DUF3778 domain-containing protein n=1 Tax=Oryza rufipogon TaxID=4529 RepID=A0A0E0NNT0_ORYRU
MPRKRTAKTVFFSLIESYRSARHLPSKLSQTIEPQCLLLEACGSPLLFHGITDISNGVFDRAIARLPHDLKSCGWISQGGRSLRCQTSISSALATPDCGKFSYSAGGRKSSSFEVAGHSLRWIWMASTDFRDPFVHLILGAVPFLSDALSRVVSGEGGLTHAQIVVIFGGLGGAELAELLEQFVLADSSHASIPNIVSTDSTSINLLLCLNQLSKQQHKSWASKEHAMNPLHHTGNQQATQQGKAGPGKGNEVSFSILTHGIHLKFVRLYHRHHLASLKLKVSWVLGASSISFLCSSIHVEVIVRVEHRLSVRLWSAGMLLVFLRFDDDFHGNHWLSPVKPPTYLRLNSKAQLVPNPWRQCHTPIRHCRTTAPDRSVS